MVFWVWAVLGVQVLIIAALMIKIYLLRKSAREIADAFADRLRTDTNTLIDISSGDKYMRELAAAINVELRKLREERHRFLEGDMELKNAVANISHDLRTPLTAICGYLDLLEQEEKSEAAGRYAAIIRNRTEMLTQLTEELFRYSVITSTENSVTTEAVVINEVLEESVAAFYVALNERGITPRIQMTEQRILRDLDRSALARIFSNLINNAMKYSDGDLDIVLAETGEIIFSNTAPGLSGVQVGKLFDRFYTVETARKSTGLGLAITRTLVEQMNGSIAAAYDNGRVRICIRFPETAPAAEQK